MNNCGCDDNVPRHIPVTNCVDVSPIQSPCVNGEDCEEVFPAECVQYNGPDLENISVLTGDRLDAILRKLNINAGSQPVTVRSSPTVALSGNGLNTSPLQAAVVLDPDPENLITAGANGLLFKWTVENATSLMNLVFSTPALTQLFCNTLDECVAQTCSVASSLSVTMN
ncbi:MAG TPA: hypothetical protein VGM30_10555 [Puia sp.]|jgi:hypothetical protein